MKHREITTPGEPERSADQRRRRRDEGAPQRGDRRQSEIARESEIDRDEDGLPDRPTKHRVPS